MKLVIDISGNGARGQLFGSFITGSIPVIKEKEDLRPLLNNRCNYHHRLSFGITKILKKITDLFGYVLEFGTGQAMSSFAHMIINL